MSKKLILYAEDDEDDRIIFEDVFSDFKDHIDIVIFDDGLELLKYVTHNSEAKPCLFVLDINMPKLDGKDTLRILRDLPAYTGTPAVLLTTSSSPVDAFFAKHFKAGFITKPDDEKQMKNVAKQLLKYCGE